MVGHDRRARSRDAIQILGDTFVRTFRIDSIASKNDRSAFCEMALLYSVIMRSTIIIRCNTLKLARSSGKLAGERSTSNE
jgi:hypothetical protein